MRPAPGLNHRDDRSLFVCRIPTMDQALPGDEVAYLPAEIAD
jgi:hypothetical protein